MNHKPLTARQKRLYAFVVGYWAEHGYGPQTREIRAATQTSSTSVVDYNVKMLCARGLLTQEPYIARTLRPVDYGPAWKGGRIIRMEQ